MNCDVYRIGKVPIANTNYEKAIEFLHATIQKGGKGYVCVSNMRTVALANKDDKYFEVMEHSLLNVPDGTPLVWCGRWWGIKSVERVCGPHLFEKMLADKTHGFKHFFLGDTEETLDALTKKVTEKDKATIVGSYSPPFKPLEEYDREGLSKKINESGANIVWTSLRAPKQDFLNQMLEPLLNNGIVMIGVGAGFRAYLGELKVADSGMLQKAGLSGWAMRRENSSIWKEFKWYVKHTFILTGYFFKIKWCKLRSK